jgi:polar amino acid transport system substrate-binding protein
MENIAADKDHKLRRRFDEMVQDFVMRLQTDPAFIAKGEDFKRYLRDSDTFNRYTLDLWHSVRDWIKADINTEESRLNAGVVQAGAWLSDELLAHPDMRASLNQHLAGMARALAPAFSSFLTRHISDTVKAWDNKDMSRQIELNIGKDLQFIRVNGTLVGGMVGLLLYVVSAFAQAGEIPVTVYADAGYPPYSYEKDGKPAGLYYDIAQAAFNHMKGYKIEVRAVPWKRGMAMIRSGTGFALYPPYMNTKDEPWTWPYSQPLFEEHVVAYCRKEVIAAKPRKRWPEDFYGLTIGNNAGFIVGGEAFDVAVKAGHLRIEEGKDSETNIIKLGMKRIDCYINDRVSIQWTLRQLKAAGKYAEGGTHAELAEAIQIAARQGYLGYTSRDKGRYTYKSDFVKQFDAAIQQMKRSGEMDAVTRNFFRTHQ